jgi:hypothetical protein
MDCRKSFWLMTILNKIGWLENILIKSNFKFNTINEFVFKNLRKNYESLKFKNYEQPGHYLRIGI